MSRILLVLLFACAVLGCQAAEDQERRCIRTGMMEPRACEYSINELRALDTESPSQGVLIDGYLQRANGGATLTQDKGGTSEALRLGATHDPDIDDAFLDALVGIRVVIYGIYLPQAGVLDVYSMRWVDEPGGRRPEWDSAKSRRCALHGSIGERACNYEVAELPRVGAAERLPVMVYGRIGTAGNQVIMSAGEPGTSATIMLDVKDPGLRAQDIASMFGERGRAVGYFTTVGDPVEAGDTIGTVEAHSLGTVSAGE